MKLWSDEGLNFVAQKLTEQGHLDCFIVTEWNVHKLKSHVSANPGQAVFFAAHFHDVLPFFSQQPDARALVASEQHILLAAAAGARTENISVVELFSAQDLLPTPAIKQVVVLAETHPYGGLVSALAVLAECRALGADWKIFEHAIPSKEMFLPLREAELHSFPRRPAEFSFAWREHLGVQVAPAGVDWGADTAFLWMPLHLASPLSFNGDKIQSAGFRFATIQNPWTQVNAQTHTFSADSWQLFDPLRLPAESTVNTGIARGCAHLMLKAWGER